MIVDTWPHRMLSCWLLSEYHRHLCLSLWYWELRNMCECIFVHACLCLSVWPPAVPFFLFMIGGVSASLLLIHHPAATGLSCDWTQHTLPSANMICRPKLDSYMLWQGYRAVWHNITHTHRSVWMNLLFWPMPKQKCIQQHFTRFASTSRTEIKLWCDARQRHAVCAYNSTKRQIQTLYTEDKAHLATAYLGRHV